MRSGSLWLLGLASAIAISAYATSPPFGLEVRPNLGPLSFPADGAQSGDVSVINAFPNLVFDLPLVFAVPPGDPDRAVVSEQRGRIFIFQNDASASSASLFLDLSDRVIQEGTEMGLLGLAFDPDYASNGYFYVNYIPAAGTRRTRIARFKVTANPEVADPSSETVLLEYSQPYRNHKGGWLGFGPDGKLYIASGDGGNQNDPLNNAQTLSSLLGKILRINADGSVPGDNPFVGDPEARGEVWARGFRNPFRCGFDRGTGDLWVGDVGSASQEEVNLVVKGGNYGWRKYIGTKVVYETDPEPENPIFPLFSYTHAAGDCSVIGGYVYRGGRMPQLNGQYVYTDYCSGTLRGLAYDGGVGISNRELGLVPGNPSSLGEDHDGELYVTTLSGVIYKLVPATAPTTPFPQRLSETGLFRDTATLLPNRGLLGYEVNAPFWSDGTMKRRWIGLPNGERIGFSADDPWSWPRGTVLVKHFDRLLADRSVRRLETRVLINGTAGWQGYTYLWNEDQLDADLVEGGETLTLSIPAADGGAREVQYEVPGRAACLACHTFAAGRVLGVNTAQLNRDRRYGSGVTDNQLHSFDHIGLFEQPIPDPGSLPRLANPRDPAAALGQRARAYLDTNCAQCHRPGGPTPVDMDLRWTTPIAATHTVGVSPSQGDLGIAGAKRIFPGSKEKSLLWVRMRERGEHRMPPLGSRLIDGQGVSLIGEWIDAGASD